MVDMAVEAVAPVVVVDCALVDDEKPDMADTGSALEAGHKPREGFFFDAQLVGSVVDDAGTPFDCVDCGEMVDEDEVEAMDEDEFVRWALFRGMNMRETSSVLIAFKPP